MTVAREILTIRPSRYVWIGIAEQDHAIPLLLEISDGHQLAGRHLLHIAQPAMLQLLKAHLSTHLLAYLTAILLLGKLSFFQIAIQARLLIRIHLLGKLLHT